MSRFSQKNKGINTTVNPNTGAVAYKIGDELELYALVCTFGLQNKFYETAKDQMVRLRSLVGKVSPEFVAKLAIYAREKMYLRTVPVVMAVELAKVHTGNDIVSRMVKRIVQRADEITELLGYYAIANNRTGSKKLGKVSNQLKRGIKDIFESGKFQEYHYGKYNRKTDVRFRDALFLTHPKPQSEEMKELFTKITEDTLATPYTWETQMSAAGQSSTAETSKKTVWEELIDSEKMGYMAMLRNLRNFIESEISQAHINKVCNFLGDAEAVKQSKQLPFRFLSAYRMLVGGGERFWGDSITVPVGLNQRYVNQVVEALERAMVASAENLPFFDNALFATDVSGSMMTPVSERSVVQSFDVCTVLCMMAYLRSTRSVTGMFGDTWKPVNFPRENVLRNANEIRRREGEVGYSTNGYKVLEWANNQSEAFDNVYMFTDCQMYGSSGHGGDIRGQWDKYKTRNPNAKLFLFDLNGYGRGTPLDIRGNDVYLISGWSDKIFEVLDQISKGGSAIDIINQIEF